MGSKRRSTARVKRRRSAARVRRKKVSGTVKRMQRFGSSLSVRGGPLQPCSAPDMPSTGFTRDGTCSRHDGDDGSHHVCLENIGRGRNGQNFCSLTDQSNWCAGRKNWCVCEWAFERAVERAGCDAFDIRCDATNQLALDHYEREGMTTAAKCIRRQCL